MKKIWSKPPQFKQSNRPLYLQTRDEMLLRIGKMDADQILPAERQLATAWDVSRITIRNAYARLVEEGVVTRAPKAYRVTAKPTGVGILMLDGFTQSSEECGFQTRTEVLSIERILPEKDMAAALMMRSSMEIFWSGINRQNE